MVPDYAENQLKGTTIAENPVKSYIGSLLEKLVQS